VIEDLTAHALDDTRLVELEDKTVSFNANGDRVEVKSKSELLGLFLLNLNERRGVEDNLSSIVSAFAINTSVGISSFSFDTAFNNVLISRGEITTVASGVSSGAINELLFRETNEVTSLNSIDTFKTTDGRESPA
jgi:hypothetical protein